MYIVSLQEFVSANSAREITFKMAGSSAFVCSIHGSAFVIGEIKALLSAYHLHVSADARTLNDVFLGELEGAIVYLDSNHADIMIVSKKQKMYINDNRCFRAESSKVVVINDGRYVDLKVDGAL